MDSNRFHFNTHPYEEHLSPFGRKVLRTLVRNWKADQFNSNNSTSQHRLTAQRNRHVLTFRGESSIRQSPPFVFNDNITKHGDNQLFVDNIIKANIAQTPTATELIHTVESTNIDTFHAINVNALRSVRNAPIPTPVEKNDCASTSDNLLKCKAHEVTNKDDDKVNDIDWDNMFDTELISHEVITNPAAVLQQLENQAQHPPAIQLQNEKGKQGKPKERNERTKVNNPKKTKNKATANKDTIPKKAKKIGEEMKPSFGKQTYKKAVKNWLEDVAVNNLNNEDFNDNIVKVNNNIGHTEIIILKDKGKSTKKAIQTQLANKDGKMKFDKPRADNVDKDEANQIIEPVIPSEGALKNKDVNINKAEKDFKEKKNNAKFVAPIKSQIPVRDVEFKIIVIDGNNNNFESLKNTEGQDLVAVLVYSNGFCQLNNQHTEDSCEPEGVLISIDEEFYYIKGHEFNQELLASLMESNEIICYEGKSILIYFKAKFDLDVHNIVMVDTKIGGCLIDPDSPPENFSDLQKLVNFSAQFTIATECKLQKAAWYSTLLKECGTKLVSLLKENQLWHVFVEIEMKLLPIIAEMERLGVKVDLQKLKSMEDILLKKMKTTEVECHKAAGRAFQINSPMQVRALIYDELQLDTKSNVKIKETLAKGAKSTSEIMLRSLISVHPLPKLILEYRHLHKAHATFLAGIAQFVKDGVVRPTWVQTAAATGRIASNNPNLQAIPKAPFNLVMFPDDNDNECEPLNFRSIYVARAGHTLLAADFQHIECRVFAHAAADEKLLAALKSGRDLFRVLAAEWLRKPEADVSVWDRERTKRIVYASMYGAGCGKLRDFLALSYERARDVLASFHRTFPSLKSFGAGVVRGCVSRGGRVRTLSGRVRVLQHISGADPAGRARAERQAVNFIVQGTAADVCKRAMVAVRARLHAAPARLHAAPARLHAAPARLLLQIHDELVWELPACELPAAASIVKEVMEQCGRRCGLDMTLPVALAAGTSWGDMTPYLGSST